ncbi:MAG: DUF86 domain-containing protein, partial [Firmicutes bacterium]|nr:DUF86 domain-containing protein [Bacillota bacterium]
IDDATLDAHLASSYGIFSGAPKGWETIRFSAKAAHWVADEGWGEPDDAGSAFDILADRGIIDRETSTALRAATGLRNRIAHGYALLDHGRVHREAQAGVPALRSFLAATVRATGV